MELSKFSLAGTKTLENLGKAFAGESQARNRYTFYANEARKIGYPVLEEVFLETSEQEKGHAEIFYDFLTIGADVPAIDVMTTVPIFLGETQNNIFEASKVEYEEWKDIYPSFAVTAENEGFNVIATSFRNIATVEGYHYTRYLNLYERMEKEMLFRNPTSILWQCTNCGLIVKGKNAPDLCPACLHLKEYFKIFCNNILPMK